MFVSVAPAALPMPSSCFLNRRSTETILFSHILKAGYQSIHVLMCTETTGKKNLLLQSQERPTFLLSMECSYPSLSRTTSNAISYISVDYEQQPSYNNQFCVAYPCVPHQVISYSSHWCESHFHAKENWLCFTFCSGPLWCCPWDEPLSIHTHATRKC